MRFRLTVFHGFCKMAISTPISTGRESTEITVVFSHPSTVPPHIYMYLPKQNKASPHQVLLGSPKTFPQPSKSPCLLETPKANCTARSLAILHKCVYFIFGGLYFSKPNSIAKEH